MTLIFYTAVQLLPFYQLKINKTQLLANIKNRIICKDNIIKPPSFSH